MRNRKLGLLLALCTVFSVALGAVVYADGEVGNTGSITSIQVTKQPDKLVYFDGQTINLSGIQLMIYYDDGSTKVVTTDNILDDRFNYDVTSTTMRFSLTEPVKVSYQSHLSNPLDIFIRDITSVRVVMDESGDELKTSYAELEKLNLSPMQLEVQWKEFNTRTLAVTDWSETIAFSQLGSKKIAVSPEHGKKLNAGTYELKAEFYDTQMIGTPARIVDLDYPVNVHGVVSIEVEQEPEKTVYHHGEELDLSGLKVRLTLTDGSTKVVDFDEFDAYGITVFPAHGIVLNTSQKEITIAHGENKATQDITVTSVITSISYGSSVWVYYDRNDPKLDLSGFKVRLTRNDGTSEVVQYNDFGTYGITTEPAHGTPLEEPKYGKAYQIKVNCPVPEGTPVAYTGIVYAFQKAVERITVTSKPLQVMDTEKGVEQKDDLNLNGLVVALAWNDGSPDTTVTLDQFQDYGLTVSPANGSMLTQIGNNRVTITHTYTKDGSNETGKAEGWFDFTVYGVQSLEWYAEPAKTEYTAGEILDLSDARVILRWSDRREIDKGFPPVAFSGFEANFLSVSPNVNAELTTENKTVTITHTISGEQLQFPIAVYAPATGVNVSPKTATLFSNASLRMTKLTAAVLPGEAKQTVIWTSSDPAVAAVDENGNVTAVSNGTAIITAATLDGSFKDSCTVTVTAQSTGNGGGYVPAPVPAPAPAPTPAIEETEQEKEKPDTPVRGESMLAGSVDKKGSVWVKITKKAIESAISRAHEEAKRQGREANGIAVVLRVNTGGKAADGKVTFSLPESARKAIVDGNVQSLVLVAENQNVLIEMDCAALSEIKGQAGGDVNITVNPVSGVKGAAKKALGNRPVYDLRVTYGSGRQVQDFGKGKVTIAIPYVLAEGQKAGSVQAVYLDSKGKVHWLTHSVYDGKMLRFVTDHFSTFGVGYSQVGTDYSDIQHHWAKDDIDFALSRRLIGGRTKTSFAPDASVARATVVTALARLAEADVSGYKNSSFSDVEDTASYMGYVEWAAEHGVVSDAGKGRFSPSGIVTREQFAVMLQNYADAMGYQLPKVYGETAFTDADRISKNAREAVRVLQMAGIFLGKDDNTFAPKAKVTKAELCAALRRFEQVMISADSMQGWAQNDSGSWMYFENGVFATGEKEIDGVTYVFNAFGAAERR